MKQTRFTLGIVFLIQAAQCVFLAISYLFSDKKRTALPFTILALLNSAAGGLCLAEIIKEKADVSEMKKAVEELSSTEIPDVPEIPVDDLADEEEFK
ncbi:MAG: hypothetical protein IKX86_05810 [Clostridia bacterium]|nr:hypothetical protein [Clostridia bacterium]MBR5768167.1 hypothetical protein [Clostridia bacterium]